MGRTADWAQRAHDVEVILRGAPGLDQRAQAHRLHLAAPSRWGGDHDGDGCVCGDHPDRRILDRAVAQLRRTRGHMAAMRALADAVERAAANARWRDLGDRGHLRGVRSAIFDEPVIRELNGELRALDEPEYDGDRLRRQVRPHVRSCAEARRALASRPGAVDWAGGAQNFARLAEASGLAEARVREILRSTKGPRVVPLHEAEVLLEAIGLRADRQEAPWWLEAEPAAGRSGFTLRVRIQEWAG